MIPNTIPITVLTGFLGSGKTTILGHLLARPEFADTAVIINEFGEIGLDHDLVETSDETLVTLTTGCLCCQMRGDLIDTLDDLLARRRAGTVPPFARVVVETTGLADPAPILQGLMVDATASRHFSLAGVVTVVDALNADATLARYPEAEKQIAVADRLVLSKTDLATSEIDGLAQRLTALNPSAGHTRADHGRIDPAVVLGHDTRDPAGHLAGVHRRLERLPDQPRHADGTITTFAIVRDRPLAAVALTLFLEALADHCGSDLLRLKGLINVAESPDQPAVIHGVQHVFTAPAWLSSWPSDDRRTRIVFIGRGIGQAWVEALLEAIECEVAELSFDDADAG